MNRENDRFVSQCQTIHCIVFKCDIIYREWQSSFIQEQCAWWKVFWVWQWQYILCHLKNVKDMKYGDGTKLINFYRFWSIKFSPLYFVIVGWQFYWPNLYSVHDIEINGAENVNLSLNICDKYDLIKYRL